MQNNKMYMTQKELVTIINSNPNIDKKLILNKAIERGYIIEGYNEPKPNLAQKVADVAIGGAANIGSTVVAPVFDRVTAGVKTAFNDKSYSQNLADEQAFSKQSQDSGAGMVFGRDAQARDLSTSKGWEQLGGDALSTAATVMPAGKAMQGATLGAKVVQGAKIGSTVGAMGGAGMSMQEGNDLGTVAKDTLVGAGVGAGAGAAIPAISAGASAVGSAAKKGAQKAFNYTKDSTGKLLYNHVDEQVAQSANRLAQNQIEPNKLYSLYSKAQQNAAKDVKSSTALEIVGNDIGNAFDDVISKRKIAGKAVGDELSKVANQKVTVADISNSFANEVKSALSKKQTKYSQAEANMLTKFNYELKSLGKDATVDDVSNFITRMRSEIDALKGSNGVMGTTNAERLIAQATGELNNKIATSFPQYANAKSEYARLSDLLEEGIGFLGKKTLDGSYKKETSVVKSSLNSIINGGKKDFLLQLENETGKPILDKAVIAAQVMKDLGDGRAESLLQKLTDESLKGKGYKQIATEWAANKVLGSESKRTLNYLSDLPAVNSSKMNAKTNIATGMPTYQINAANNIPPAISNISPILQPITQKVKEEIAKDPNKAVMVIHELLSGLPTGVKNQVIKYLADGANNVVDNLLGN